MPIPLRSRVYSIMFCTSVKFIVSCCIGSLQTIDYCNSQTAGQIGIFSIRLLSTPPTRITENIHIRSPHCKCLITCKISFTIQSPALCSCFIRYCRKDFIQQTIINDAPIPIACGNTVANPVRARP